MKGIILSLIACFIWGLICLIPQYMEGYSPFEISLGRYLVFGIVSTFIFFLRRRRFSLSIWLKVTYFSFMCTYGYYIFFITGLRYTSPAIGMMIIGLAPILIAFYGNWKNQEGNFTKLLFPSFLILVGLICTHIPHLSMQPLTLNYCFGLLCSFSALFSWSWYVVANAKFLQKHPQISFNDWTTLVGVGSLGWSLLFGTIAIASGGLDGVKFSFSFVLGSAILGFFCSWVAATLWNQASYHLSLSLAGQLTIFETIFGLCFVYIAKQSLPPLWEGLGITLFLGAIFYAIRVLAKPAVEKAEN